MIHFMSKNNKLILVILLVLVILIMGLIFFVWLVSHNYFAFFGIDLSDKNDIGDALGGLTAPFIGIFVAVLTFLAFYVQYDFNKKQLKFMKEERINQTVDEYSKVLEFIIAKDNLRDRDFVALLDRYYDLLLSTNLEENIEKFKTGIFAKVLFSGFLNVVECNNEQLKKKIDLDVSLISSTYTIKEVSQKFQANIDVILSFEKLLKTLNEDLSLLDIEEYDLEIVISIFLRKFQLMYTNYSSLNTAFFLIHSIYDENLPFHKFVLKYYSEFDYNKKLLDIVKCSYTQNE